jgi:hypothetical protein
MSKVQFVSKANQDYVTAAIIRAMGGGSGNWSLREADRVEKRATYNLSKLSNRQITRGASRCALE